MICILVWGIQSFNVKSVKYNNNHHNNNNKVLIHSSSSISSTKLKFSVVDTIVDTYHNNVENNGYLMDMLTVFGNFLLSLSPLLP